MKKRVYFDREAMGARLQEARLRKGLTRAVLAKRIGVTSRTVLNYEKGATSPGYDMLRDLRRLLGVSLDWLILGAEATATLAPARAAA